MKTVGLITEYNPFHNGHLHHLQESKRLANAEVSVAVMSGHFLQRGEPALVDKWIRTRMALAAGVDVVVELPFPWACNSAPHFAAGAVAALDALGGIAALCFGSESGELQPLQGCARFLLQEESTVATKSAALLKTGMTYPAAREQVVRELAGEEVDPELLATPNNILGIEYLKALHQSKSLMTPLTLRRIGAGYHEDQAIDQIASATGLRKMLAQGEGVGDYQPESCVDILADALVAGETIDETALHRLLVATIIRDAEQLPSIYQVENGLENRLIEAALASRSYENLIDTVKARQLTRTRIQRILAYVLLGVRRDLMQGALSAGPRYLHLLGCSESGQKYLAATRKKRSLPLVQNFSRVQTSLKRYYGQDSTQYRQSLQQLLLQERATAIYAVLSKTALSGHLNRDYFVDLIVG